MTRSIIDHAARNTGQLERLVRAAQQEQPAPGVRIGALFRDTCLQSWAERAVFSRNPDTAAMVLLRILMFACSKCALQLRTCDERECTLIVFCRLNRRNTNFSGSRKVSHGKTARAGGVGWILFANSSCVKKKKMAEKREGKKEKHKIHTTSHFYFFFFGGFFPRPLK